MERCELSLRESRGDARRMNPRAKQAFIGIYIANSPQDSLVEQERFDARAARPELRAKFLQCNFQRLRSQPPLKSGHERFRDEQDAAKAANVRVAQFAPIIEGEKNVRVRRDSVTRMAHRKLARHPQMDHQVQMFARRIGCNPALKSDADEFTKTLNVGDARSRQMFRQLHRIVYEIRLAQPDVKDGASRQRGTQPAHYSFDFGKLRHEGPGFKIAQSQMR